jgi:serine/threonine protein kinase
MSLEGLQLGQYRLLRLIGSGGMGDVYLAEDARINQQVAIKLSRTEAPLYSDDEVAKEAARLFQREAKAIAQLDHPLILPLFSYGEENVNGVIRTYIVMPFRKEGSLTTWLRQRKHGEHLSLQDVVHIVNQAADALQYAHDRHIVHQDVKPPNFLIRSRAEGASTVPDLLLTDFGIAKLSTATSGVSNTVRGTATYMAPEQWSGNAVPATDQYALAVMTYELLTGRPPFQGRPEQMMYLHFSVQPEPPGLYNPLLSKNVDSVILKALSKNPRDRFPSISTFAQTLQQAVQSADGSTFIKMPDRGKLPTLHVASSVYEQIMPASKLVRPTVPASLPEINGTQNPASRRRMYPGRSILLFGLVLILTASGLGFFAFQQAKQANTKNIGTIVPTQANKVTPLATPATTQVLNTSTMVPAHPYTSVSGTLVLNDPLSDNSKGYNWDEIPTGFGACTFTRGGYDVVATNNNTYHRCGAQRTNFSNFIYEVEARILTGSCAAMIFRGNFPHFQYYYFHLCQDGSYALWLYTQNGPATKAFIESSSSAIHTHPGQSNLMAVVAINDAITLYVNHQAIYMVHDSTYIQGEIGIGVDNTASPTEAMFHNAKVWILMGH